MHFSLPSIKCSAAPPSFRLCWLNWAQRCDLITARSTVVGSSEKPPNIWLTVAKNAFVSWPLNKSPHAIERRRKRTPIFHQITWQLVIRQFVIGQAIFAQCVDSSFSMCSMVHFIFERTTVHVYEQDAGSLGLSRGMPLKKNTSKCHILKQNWRLCLDNFMLSCLVKTSFNYLKEICPYM